VAREAVRKSLVLLKNEKSLLPLSPGVRVLVAGDGADSIGKQSGGWTLSWQGNDTNNSEFPNGTSIWGGVREAVEAGGGTAELSADGSFTTKPDVAIVVFGEEPYAEFQGDRPNLDFAPTEGLATLQRLKAQGIPTVAVFLSGRPLWVNPEINASDAFVAAWLPGTEGGGVADLLFKGADRLPRYDFTGRLSFSWPRRADQYELNRGDARYDPLFAYGYGLTYRQGRSVPHLSEVSGVAPPQGSIDVFFAAGRAAHPWSLALRDAGGAATVGSAYAASPGGVVQSNVVDAGAQENARSVTWSGQGPGALLVRGAPVDLQRQATGDMAVNLTVRVDRAPTAAMRLAAGCGAGCEGGVDVSSLLRGPAPAPRTLKVKLSCLRSAGADLSRVDQPVVLSTSGSAALTILDMRIAPNTGDAVCPG
jgi:beta-glucosidase